LLPWGAGRLKAESTGIAAGAAGPPWVSRLKRVLTTRRELLSVLAITLAGLLFRLLVVVFGADPIPAPLSDSDYYHVVASNLAEGRGFSYINGPSAFWPPGYPFFLAILYWLFWPSVKIAMVANAVAGALAILVTYAFGRVLWGPRVGLLAAALMAALPSHIFWSAALLSEVLFTLIFIAAFWLVLESVSGETGRVRWPALLGFAALFAAGVVTRGQMAVLLPVALLFWWRRGVRPIVAAGMAAIPVLVTLALVVPWSVRNTRVLNEPIILSSNVGYNVRIGHNPDSFGRFMFPDVWPPDKVGQLSPELEVELNREGLRRGLRYAVTSPLHEVWLSVQKVHWLYRADMDSLVWIESFSHTPLPSVELEWAYIRGIHASYYVFFTVAVLGAPLTLGIRDPRRLALLITIVLWTVFHILFFSEPRYHLPVLPIMAVMAARALLWVSDRWPELRSAVAIGPAATGES